MFAWMGPFIGALIRPIGGWISDKVGGAKVTQAITVMMILSALGVAYFMQAAYQSATPEEYFRAVLPAFPGAVRRHRHRQRLDLSHHRHDLPQGTGGPALGWTSAVAAYGAFIIPMVFKGAIESTGAPDQGLYIFVTYYAISMVILWFFYLRKGAPEHGA